MEMEWKKEGKWMDGWREKRVRRKKWREGERKKTLRSARPPVRPPSPSPYPHLVQVRLHQLKHHVYVLEVARGGREHDVADLDDVWVAQQAEQLDLAEDARRVRHVVKHVVDLLDGDLGPCQGVQGGADDAVGALA